MSDTSAEGPVTYVEAFWRGRAVDDVADGFDRLLGECRALVAGEVELYVRRFAVLTLGARRGNRVSPEVLHVLDMSRVRPQLLDDAVVVAVGVVAELAVALQNQHREVIGVGLLELLTGDLHRLH
jgi:hypothetical protein